MKRDEIQSCLDEIYKKYQLPGVSVAIVYQGKVDYFIINNEELNSFSLHENTKFGIGCCTKAFVASVAAIVFQEHGLDFDMPIREYYPIIKFYDSDYQKNITLKDLLAHTTGFSKQNHSFYFPLNIEEKLLHIYEMYAPVTKLRTNFQYNNFSYLLVGLILEYITGIQLEELLKRKIFLPLGMECTGFGHDKMDFTDFAIPHQITPKDDLYRVDNHKIYYGGAAGGLFSTIADLSRWLLELLDDKNSKRILKEQIIKCITSAVVMGTEKGTNYLSAPFYAMGWYGRNFKGVPMIYHEGMQIGYTCMISYIPQSGIGIIAMTNVHNHVAPQEIAYSIYDILLRKEKTNWYRFFKVNRLFLKETQEKQKKEFVEKYSILGVNKMEKKQIFGSYTNHLLGKLLIDICENDYILKINEVVFHFSHYMKNIYTADIYGSEILLAFSCNKIVIPIECYENPTIYIKVN